MVYELTDRDIITPSLRIAYAHGIFEARVPDYGEPGEAPQQPKFDCVLLIPPSVDLGIFTVAIKAAMMDKWGKLIPMPASKNPVKDAMEKEGKDGFVEGWHYINVSSKRRPHVVDQSLNPILDKDMVYSGCWVRAHINAYCTDHKKGGQRVSFGLNSIQFEKDGERFGAQVATPDMVFKPLAKAKAGGAQGSGKTKPAADLDELFS